MTPALQKPEQIREAAAVLRSAERLLAAVWAWEAAEAAAKAAAQAAVWAWEASEAAADPTTQYNHVRWLWEQDGERTYPYKPPGGGATPEPLNSAEA